MFVRRLYLCGGGTNAVALGGAVGHLEEAGVLRFVKEWMGVSAGALGAMCLAAGYTVTEMKRFWLEFDYQTVTDPDVATGWLMNMGYDTGNRVQKLLNAMLKEKGHADTITFEQLAAKTGYSLRVWATNMNKGVLEEFSDKKTPTYCVSHAVRASMTLPYYFQPFKCPVTADTYLDGGVITNYPLHYLTEEERSDTLGIMITYKPAPIPSMDLQDLMFSVGDQTTSGVSGLLKYLTRPLSLFTQSRSHQDYAMFKEQTVNIQMASRSPVDFEMTMEQKLELMGFGLKAAKTFLKGYRKPVRRYSVS